MPGSGWFDSSGPAHTFPASARLSGTLRGMTTASDTTATPAPPEPAQAAPTTVSEPTPVATAQEPAEPAPAASEPTPDPAPVVDAEPEPESPAADLPAQSDGTTAVDDTKWTHPDGWKYDWIDYRGDRLAVRIPNKSAIHAVNNLRYSGPELQLRLFQKFIANHVSPESYERVNDRMLDPDDEGYSDIEVNNDPLGELVNELMKLGQERATKQLEALAEVRS